MADRYRAFQAGSRVRMRLVADDRLVKSVRNGDRGAFEALYDRHVGGLLSFCLYMLGSRHDAEDAVQATFASAYRALLADERQVMVRPWLFTIARNACLSILRRRHPTEELNGEVALRGDPHRETEARDEIRQVLSGLLALPERQRTTLTLAELHGLTHAEIATVLGVRTEQVKAYAYQARTNLLSERTAHETSCRDIRQELVGARGVALRKTRLSRHLRSCSDCRAYRQELSHQRHHLAALFPVTPTLALKLRALQDIFGGAEHSDQYVAGAAMAGSAVGGGAVAGGGANALLAKLAAGVVALGAGAGVGAAVLTEPSGSAGPGAAPPASASPLAGIRTSSASAARLVAGVSAPGGGGQAGVPAPAGRGGGAPPGVRTRFLALTEATYGARSRGVASGGGSEHSVLSDSHRAISPKSAHPVVEERRHQREAGAREREASTLRRSERRQTLESRQLESVAARRQHRLQREEREHAEVGTSRPPRSEEQLHRQHEKRKHKLEERSLP
jgi:RNA polymerase sigma factor (sigma-70 family)